MHSKTARNKKRIFLRPPAEPDFTEFTRLNLASQDLHRGLVQPPLDREQFEKFLERNRIPGTACFLICQRGDGAIAGSITLSQIVYGGFQNAYLGYYLGAGFTGKGYMSEAVEAILRHAFKTLRLHRIEANVQPHNEASIAVLKRTGFVREGYSERYLKIGGRWRDHERWAIIVENWKKKNGNKRSTDTK